MSDDSTGAAPDDSTGERPDDGARESPDDSTGETDHDAGGAQSDTAASRAPVDDLVDGVLDGDHRSLARAISVIENRTPGYRDLVGALHEHAGDAAVVGITGSPGTGKSTLVDKLALAYRDRGETVGVIAVDPASPFTGGAVLGDRIRMGSTVGDMDVFVRSMSARGTLGGLSAATADAVTALDAFGKDRVVVETVGAGQNEIDVVRTADTVAVLVQPGAGDTVQTLKAGILEIADCFVVNKADLDGADRTVQELTEMLQLEGDVDPIQRTGHHGAAVGGGDGDADGGGADASEREDAREEGATGSAGADEHDVWTPPVLETVATKSEGVESLIEAFADHRAYLERSGALQERARERAAEAIRTQLRADVGDLVQAEIDRRGGIEALADAVHRRETNPYAVAEELLEPFRDCLEDHCE